VSVGVVRRDAFDVDFRALVDDVLEMTAQAVPIGLAVLVVDITLVPDAHSRLSFVGARRPSRDVAAQRCFKLEAFSGMTNMPVAQTPAIQLVDELCRQF